MESTIVAIWISVVGDDFVRGVGATWKPMADLRNRLGRQITRRCWDLLPLIALMLLTARLAAADDVTAIVSRAETLDKAGANAEATMILAKSYSSTQDPEILRAWISLDCGRIAVLEKLQRTNVLTPMPTTDSAEHEQVFQKVVDAAPGQNWRGQVERTVYSIIRSRMKNDQPPIMSDEDVGTRLAAFAECGKSVQACSRLVSQALETSDSSRLAELLESQKHVRELVARIKRARANFISYDYIAPKVYEAHIFLVYDDYGYFAAFVSPSSLRSAAERLGEVARDVKYANKDIKRCWLEATSKLKHHAGAERFKDLEATATLVGDPTIGPDQWAP